MKKLTFLLLGLIAFAFTSCSDDDPSINVYPGEKIVTLPVLEALPAPAEYVVEQDVNEETEAGTFKWSAATLDYNGTISYYIQIAPAGSDFANAVNVFSASVSTTSQAFTFGDLNNALTRLNATLVANGQESLGFGALAEVEVRVKAIAEKSQAVGYSVSQLMKINAFENITVVTPKLFLVGAPQAYYGGSAWDEKNGLPLNYVGDGTTKIFEAFVKVASGEGFKLTGDGKTWNGGNYGTDGAVAAISGGQEFSLIDSGGSSDLKVADVDGSGLYYVRVDMDAMKAKVIKMQWGVIGAATAGGWGGETPMSYDFATNVWSYTASDITAGEMKFRSKNTGDYIVGKGDDSDDWTYNVGQLLKVLPDGGPNWNVAAGVKPTLSIGFDGTAVVTGL